MLEKKNLTYVILKPNLNTNLKLNLNYLKPKLKYYVNLNLYYTYNLTLILKKSELLKLLNWNEN